jgi:membrane protease YdiL (CAAX protease family)
MNSGTENVPAVPPVSIRDFLWVTFFVFLASLPFSIIETYFEEKISGHPYMIISAALSLALMGWAAWHFVCRKRGLGFGTGFALNKPGVAVALCALGLGIAMAAAGHFLLEKFPPPPGTPLERLFMDPVGRVILSILALVGVPIEEMYYRGLMFPAIQNRRGTLSAIMWTTVFFVFMHFAQIARAWAAILLISVVGLVLTLQRHFHRSLTPPLLTHLSYNIFIVIEAWLALPNG